MTTLREYLEAIRDRNAGVEGSIDDSPFDHADAVAALAILDAARWDVLSLSGYEGVVRSRSVPDPESTA